MTLVALVTYKDLPELDPDDQLLARELEDRGLKTQAAIWNDSSINWHEADLCIIRSTWDYHLDRDRFCAWADTVEECSKLWNPAALVRWSSRKTYLRDLHEKGIPTIPTVFLSAGSSGNLKEILQERGWEKAVIKPAVGLATAGVKKTGLAVDELSEGQQHLEKLLRVDDVLVQPFLPSIDTYGEHDLIFIEGEYSHCVQKAPFQKLAVAGKAGEASVTAAPDEILLAKQIVETLDYPSLFGRVDLVRDDNGSLAVLELELIEPSLFLAMNSNAVQRLADAVCKRLR
jgi:glutathione synthase/RimK-type ligase-like ATP-grasp enzyme